MKSKLMIVASSRSFRICFYQISRDGFYGFVQSAHHQSWRGNSNTCPPELRLAICMPLLFENLPALGVHWGADTKNLPAWYPECARFFRDGCLSQFTDGLAKARRKNATALGARVNHSAATRVGLMMKRISEKADLSKVRFLVRRAGQGWCFW